MNSIVCTTCSSNNVKILKKRLFGEAGLYRCTSCKSEFLNPQPSDSRLEVIYGPDYYNSWRFEREDVVLRMKQMTFERAVSLVELKTEDVVLELGSATGDFAELMASKGINIFGIDLNGSACEIARKRVPEAEFFAGTLRDLPWPEKRFDCVAMFDFIEHVRNPKDELTLVCTRLKKDGVLLLSTPNTSSISRKVLRSLWPQYREEHLTLFSLKGLTDLLNSLGFEIIRVKRTKKYCTANYLLGQLMSFPIPLLTQVISKLWKILPIRKSSPFGFYYGEMTIVAIKATH